MHASPALMPPLTAAVGPFLSSPSCCSAPQRKGDAETQLRQKQVDLAASHSEYAQVVAALEEVTSRVQEHQRTEQELNSKIKQCNGGGLTAPAVLHLGHGTVAVTVVSGQGV
jgi:hypothetical protein